MTLANDRWGKMLESSINADLKCSLHFIMWKISLKIRFLLQYSYFVNKKCFKIQGILCCKENRRKGGKSIQMKCSYKFWDLVHLSQNRMFRRCQ